MKDRSRSFRRILGNAGGCAVRLGVVDVQQQNVNTRVFCYLVNTPITQGDPYSEVLVQQEVGAAREGQHP